MTFKRQTMAKTDYSVFDNMLEGLQVIGPDYSYVYVNRAVARQANVSMQDLLGVVMMEKFPGIEHTAMFGKLRRCMEDKKPCNMINRFQFPDGRAGWFDLRMEPVDDGVLIMSFDITDRKLLEEQLRELNELLELKVHERTRHLVEVLDREKEHVEVKDAFVSMASHELRTPISVITNSVVLAEHAMKTGNQDALERNFGRIRTATQNMVGILEDFLSLDSLQRGLVQVENESVDLEDFMKAVTEEFDNICKEGQMIKFSHNGRRDVMLGKNILRNILFNLISNAIKYSENNVRVTTNLNDGHLEICVKDAGIGIPEAQQVNLFSKFFRASNTTDIQGTGLGLNIVKHYVDLLHGSIDFCSKENKGTEFRVVLPVEQE